MISPLQFSFAGHDWVALPEGALFWPRHGALIVADLHLEKASWYARLGQPLPPYDSRVTVELLAKLALQTNAKAIWCLGDSFHDRDGSARLETEAAAQLARLARERRITFVAGNHDGLAGGAGGAEAVDELLVYGMMFRHAAEIGETVIGTPSAAPMFATEGLSPLPA